MDFVDNLMDFILDPERSPKYDQRDIKISQCDKWSTVTVLFLQSHLDLAVAEAISWLAPH